jgi:uncharacterized protein (DUF362 family)
VNDYKNGFTTNPGNAHMKPKVLIMRCDDYDVNKLAAIIKQGIGELGVGPFGRTMLKPNCVMAHPELFPYAYTRKEVVEAVAIAIKEMGRATEISVGERSGITIPTRFCFWNAGYMDVIKRHGLKPVYFDEARHVPVKLAGKGRLRDQIHLPEPVVNSDFLINMPKFKAHPWTRLTLSQKNFIGLQDDRYRLVDHNSYLEQKIVDLQEAVKPGLIVIDAITAGQKMMLTPTPFRMGAIVMGINSCAVDAVCCRMVNVDPNDVVHLKLASERGFGPINLEEIEVGGDYPLKEAQNKNLSFELCMEHIDDYFADTRLSCITGSFPENHSKDYCWGGCPGALQEAMHIFKTYYPDVFSSMAKIKYVVGKVEGPIELAPDERLIFMGDCTSWEGEIDGKRVRIESSYKRLSNDEANRPPSNDMIRKILGSFIHCLRNRSSRYIHAPGCPVSVAAHINYLSFLGNIPNVNFDMRSLIPVNVAYWQMRFNRFWNNLRS